MTIHEMPAALFDAWEQALGGVPVEVTHEHHALDIYLDRPVGAIVLENQRFVPQDVPEPHQVLFIRGHAFRRGAA